jgi:hypothetical protein
MLCLGVGALFLGLGTSLRRLGLQPLPLLAFRACRAAIICHVLTPIPTTSAKATTIAAVNQTLLRRYAFWNR